MSRPGRTSSTCCNYPTNHEAWFDIVMNEVDGEWYEERNPVTLAPNIDIPVWLQLDQGRGWTLDGTIELYNSLKGPKKLTVGPYPPMQSRPFIEEHDKMFRWYDHWIKGIDNGVMDEPAVSVFVEGSREVVTADQWPPKDIEYTSLYLRPRHKLSTEPELMGAEYAAPDGFYQAPLTVTDKVEIISWSTAPFEEPTEMIGTGAAHIFAEIDQPDTNFILRLWDAAPNGKRQLITTGYLKASHRELDEPHDRGRPVPPAHPRSAGGAGHHRGVRAAALPVREHVPAGAPPRRRAVERRAARRRAQLAAAPRRVPPAGGAAGHAQDLPRRRAPVPPGAAVHDSLGVTAAPARRRCRTDGRHLSDTRHRLTHISCDIYIYRYKLAPRPRRREVRIHKGVGATMTQRNVLVVGGGIGGLSAAIALRQEGHDVHVVERYESAHASVFGVGIIQPINALRALDAIGAAQACLDAGYAAAAWGAMYDYEGNFLRDIHGTPIESSTLPPMNGVTRPKLHEILTERANEVGVTIQYSTSFVDLEERENDVLVTLDNGDQISVDVVVGADGVSSRVRKFVLDAELAPRLHRPVGVPPEHAPPCPRSTASSCRRAERHGRLRADRPRSGIHVLQQADGARRAPRHGRPPRGAPQGARGLRRPRRPLPRRVPQRRPRRHRPAPGGVDDRTRAVAQGPRVLMGDAVHAITPHLGQGAAQAIEDGVVLGEVLTKHDDLETALVEFTDRRFERCKLIVETSRNIGDWEMGNLPGFDNVAATMHVLKEMAKPRSERR